MTFPQDSGVQPSAERPVRHAYLLTLCACATTTLLATPLLGYLDLANIVMLFLLTVLLVAVQLGKNPAVLASVASVLLFDVFFVPPRFSLQVANIQYLVTFAVMLVTGLVTAHLAAGLRQQAVEARARERRTAALYQAARSLAGALTNEQVVDVVQLFLRSQMAARSAILLPDEPRHALLPLAGGEETAYEPHLAWMAFQDGQTVSSGVVRRLGEASVYLPLQGATRRRGVLAVRFDDPQYAPDEEMATLLEAFASLVAVAIERLHYESVAQASEVRMQTERLRSSVLSALSHDLRTPLTAMVGLADSLFLVKPPLPPMALESAQALHEQAERLAALVGNLLDMARLNAGTVRLRKEWQPLDDVIGASIHLLSPVLAGHDVKVRIAPELPLLAFDAVLIERVFCNLLDNAVKYGPPSGSIEIAAQCEGAIARIGVLDEGPGFPPGPTEHLFELFVRASAESGKPGSGLGLAICKAIVEAHGGAVFATNRATGGACVGFTLPIGDAPVVEEEAP